MSADKLGSGMYDNICAVLDRAEQVRSSERVVHHERQAVFVCDLCDRINIGDIAVRIAERFQIDRSGVILNGALDFLQIVCIHESRFYPVLRKRMCQEVIAAAVDRLLCDHMAAVCSQRFDRVGDRCCAACQCQCCGSAFESCESLFQHVLCGVGQSAVNVSGISQSEAVRRVFAVMEYIGSRLVNGHGSRIGSRIGFFLSHV